MKKMKKVAIFDIDGTIFRSSLLIELTEAMIQQGIFKKSVKNIYAKAYKKWQDRKGPYGEYIMAVVKAFESNMKGMRAKDFFRISKEVADFHKDRTYRYTRQLIKDLKKKGYYMLAISHSPLSVLKDFCVNIGFNKVYGRMHDIDANDRLTGGTMHLEIINDKSKTLQRAIEKEGLTLKDSVGVGDTESDIRFLEMVKHPICFNPNSGLYKHAKKVGWKVVVERKDVIFEL